MTRQSNWRPLTSSDSSRRSSLQSMNTLKGAESPQRPHPKALLRNKSSRSSILTPKLKVCISKQALTSSKSSKASRDRSPLTQSLRKKVGKSQGYPFIRSTRWLEYPQSKHLICRATQIFSKTWAI